MRLDQNKERVKQSLELLGLEVSVSNEEGHFNGPRLILKIEGGNLPDDGIDVHLIDIFLEKYVIKVTLSHYIPFPKKYYSWIPEDGHPSLPLIDSVLWRFSLEDEPRKSLDTIFRNSLRFSNLVEESGDEEITSCSLVSFVYIPGLSSKDILFLLDLVRLFAEQCQDFAQKFEFEKPSP